MLHDLLNNKKRSNNQRERSITVEGVWTTLCNLDELEFIVDHLAITEPELQKVREKLYYSKNQNLGCADEATLNEVFYNSPETETISKYFCN